MKLRFALLTVLTSCLLTSCVTTPYNNGYQPVYVARTYTYSYPVYPTYYSTPVVYYRPYYRPYYYNSYYYHPYYYHRYYYTGYNGYHWHRYH